jgi:hypothetical protein
MEVPKDIYLYLMNFTDDKTTINMLSVNKKYYSLFENIFKKKYPFWVCYKKEETWQRFYVKMSYYIEKLKERDIPYIPVKSFNLEFICKSKGISLYNKVMLVAASEGYINIVDLMIKKGATNFNRTMRIAAENGHIEIVKLMVENGAKNHLAKEYARLEGHEEIVKYLEEIERFY